jgi:hypothetical protein
MGLVQSISARNGFVRRGVSGGAPGSGLESGISTSCSASCGGGDGHSASVLTVRAGSEGGPRSLFAAMR